MNTHQKLPFGLMMDLPIILIAGFSSSLDGVTDDAADDWIGQMFVFGFRGTKLDDDAETLRQIGNLNPGGVILFDYDVPSQSDSRNIVNA